jgi:hypothetical protein
MRTVNAYLRAWTNGGNPQRSIPPRAIEEAKLHRSVLMAAASAAGLLSSPQMLAAATPAFESIFAERAATEDQEGVSVSFSDDTNGLASLYVRQNNTEQSVMECFTIEAVPDGDFISMNLHATQATATLAPDTPLGCSVGVPPVEVTISCETDGSYEQSISGRNVIKSFGKKTITISEVHSSVADCALTIDDVSYDIPANGHNQIYRSVNTERSKAVTQRSPGDR